MPEQTTTTAGELVRQFAHYSDLALSQPVIVTRNGRPRSVLLSFEEYERLKRREAFLAADTPERFLAMRSCVAPQERSALIPIRIESDTPRRRVDEIHLSSLSAGVPPCGGRAKVDFIHPTVLSNSGEESRRQRWLILQRRFLQQLAVGWVLTHHIGLTTGVRGERWAKTHPTAPGQTDYAAKALQLVA